MYYVCITFTVYWTNLSTIIVGHQISNATHSYAQNICSRKLLLSWSTFQFQSFLTKLHTVASKCRSKVISTNSILPSVWIILSVTFCHSLTFRLMSYPKSFTSLFRLKIAFESKRGTMHGKCQEKGMQDELTRLDNCILH